MRIRRNLESLSLRLRSRCLRTATALHMLAKVGHAGLQDQSCDCTHLLDKHVKVLGDLGGEACIKSLRQSETKQRRNCDMYVMYCVPALASSHLPLRTFFHAGSSVPLDLRIRRILFPAKFCQHLSPLQLRIQCSNIPVTILTWATPWESRRTTPI
jgi:hypothetical protein